MKSAGWAVFTSNAYVALPTENCVQTFYFEKVLDGTTSAPVGGRLNSTLPSAAIVPSTQGVATAPVSLGASHKAKSLASVFQASDTVQPLSSQSQQSQQSQSTATVHPLTQTQTQTPTLTQTQSRPPGPAASSVVSISGGARSTDAVQTTVQSHHQQHTVHQRTSVSGVVTSQQQQKQHIQQSQPVESTEATDAQAAAVRRSSLASSLSSMTSGDAYLFARKVAGRGACMNGH